MSTIKQIQRWGADGAITSRLVGNQHPYSYAYKTTRTEAERLAGTLRKWSTLAQQTEGHRAYEVLQRCQKGRLFLQQLDYAAAETDLQPPIYNPLEPYRARIVPTTGSLIVNINNKEDERSLVIRGETTAASGAKPSVRAQLMSVLPGFIFMSTLLQ